MHKVSKFLLLLCFCSAVANAQNKYAVILGINDYYQSPTTKHPSSLHGCVNDARSIRELLLNRFAFKSANVYTLFDSNVTKASMSNLLFSVLAKCHAGDAVVFYYSGHGVWMGNDYETDPIKGKKSQAMVMSNLYAPNLNCLVTDETLKHIFNKFLDKGVKVTAIVDCCFSGELLTAPSPGNNGSSHAKPRRKYWYQEPPSPTGKSIDFGIIYNLRPPEWERPNGCTVDSLGQIIEKKDTDGDGVPDCSDWQINSPVGWKVSALGIAIDKLSDDQDSALMPTVAPTTSGVDRTVRSYNLKDSVGVDYQPLEKRPYERKGKGFLFLSAATQNQYAEEVTDEAGLKHGAFTKALLTVYKWNPSDLPVSSLKQKIKGVLKWQRYGQVPTFHYDSTRLGGNLIGLSNERLPTTLVAHCVVATSGNLILNKGFDAGVAKGDVFTKIGSPNETVQILSATNTTATAVDKTGSVQKGDAFELSNPSASSLPLVRIYIPETPFTQAGFQAFFQHKIQPFASQKNYADYNIAGEGRKDNVRLFISASNQFEYHIWNREDVLVTRENESRTNNVVLLPLPSYIVGPLKKMLKEDPNISLVNSAKEADYVLYLNYANAYSDASLNKPGGFVFYYHPPLNNNDDTSVFSLEAKVAPTVFLAGTALQSLCEGLHELTRDAIRYNTERWLAGKPK